MIHITASAAKEIDRIRISRQKPNSNFRLGVKTGGCSGLLYVFDLDEQIQANDRTFESNHISIVIDEASYPYLRELKLDYSEDLMGGGFRFQNPNASSACGCGQSFRKDEGSRISQNI
jgi:iron-sulfur cluster assembly accessory protein